MGVLPLQFVDGATANSLGLTGQETFDFLGLDGGAAKLIDVVATAADGSRKQFKAKVRIDTPKELDYYRHGGILQYVLRTLVAKESIH
jgi:aconitate hydratase